MIRHRKSTCARWFAARYTRGEMQGCWYGQPQNVAYIAPSEESLTYTIKNGLHAVGANMEHIFFPHVYAENKVVQLRSILDEDALTKELVDNGITVVIVDPVMSTIGGGVDVHRNNDVRAFIEPWARIATPIDGIVHRFTASAPAASIRCTAH